jgi:hypothetical protein
MFSDKYWARLYIYLRALETGQDWSQAKFENKIDDFNMVVKYKGILTALKSIEPEFYKTISTNTEIVLDNFDDLLYNLIPRQQITF